MADNQRTFEVTVKIEVDEDETNVDKQLLLTQIEGKLYGYESDPDDYRFEFWGAEITDLAE